MGFSRNMRQAEGSPLSGIRGGEENVEIRVLELLEGAKKARGLTVVIDVFRAFKIGRAHV